MDERPSLKLADMREAARTAPDPPVPMKDLNFEQRATLKAYWRARTVRYLGLPVTLKLICSHATEDWGYGTVVRSRVPKVIKELEELGFEFTINEKSSDDTDERKPRTPRIRRSVPTATVGEDPTPRPEVGAGVRQPALKKPPRKVREAGEPKRKSRATPESTVPRLQRSSDGAPVLELVGDADPERFKSAVVRLSRKSSSEEPANSTGSSEVGGRGTKPEGTGEQPAKARRGRGNKAT